MSKNYLSPAYSDDLFNTNGKLPLKKKKILKKYCKAIQTNELPVDELLKRQNIDQILYKNPPEEIFLDLYDSGVHFGHDFLENHSGYLGKPAEDDGHILIVGGPGCHKTTGIILPTILTWRGTFVAIDIKGDISDFCLRHQNEIAYPTKILDFANLDNTLRYDPFLRLREAEESELISYSRELALSMIPMPSDIREPFWILGAQNILTAIIIYAVGKGLDFCEMIEMILATSVEQICKAIEGSDNDLAKMFITQYTVDQPQKADHKELLGSFIDLTNSIRDFLHVQAKNIFSGKGEVFDFEQDVYSGNLVIHIPEQKLSSMSGAVRLILRQFFSTLSDLPEKHSSFRQSSPPVLLLWDEMPRFGKFEDLLQAFSTLRSRGVTICAVIQSFAQLDHIYGPSFRQVLVDCCSYIVIGAVQDVDTQRYCAQLVGNSSGWELSFGESYHPAYDKFSFSRNLSHCREPILYPEDFATLSNFIVVTPYGKFCVKKAPIIEKSRISPDRRRKPMMRKLPDMPPKETEKKFFRKILEDDISAYEEKQHPPSPKPARDESVKTDIDFHRNQLIGKIFTQNCPELECFQPKLNENANKIEFQLFVEFIQKISKQKSFQNALKKMVHEKLES